MPVISGRRALAAWARPPDEHLAGCTVLGGGVPCARARGAEAAVRFQEHRLAEWQRASLPVPGPCHTPGASPLLSGLCSEKARSRPHDTELRLQGDGCPPVLFTAGGSLRPRGQAQSRSRSLCLVRLHLGALASLRSTQRRAARPTLAASPAAEAHTGRRGRGAQPGAQPTVGLGNGSQEAGSLLLTHKPEILIPL